MMSISNQFRFHLSLFLQQETNKSTRVTFDAISLFNLLFLLLDCRQMIKFVFLSIFNSHRKTRNFAQIRHFGRYLRLLCRSMICMQVINVRAHIWNVKKIIEMTKKSYDMEKLQSAIEIAFFGTHFQCWIIKFWERQETAKTTTKYIAAFAWLFASACLLFDHS